MDRHRNLGNAEGGRTKRRACARPSEPALPRSEAAAPSPVSPHGKRLLMAYDMPGPALTSICLCAMPGPARASICLCAHCSFHTNLFP